MEVYDIEPRGRPEYEYSIETHDAERIMQSESIHVRTSCAKPRKKNTRVRPAGNVGEEDAGVSRLSADLRRPHK